MHLKKIVVGKSFFLGVLKTVWLELLTIQLERCCTPIKMISRWARPRWTLVIKETCTPVFSVPKSQGIQHPRSGCSLPRLTWFPGVRRSANPSGFPSCQPGSLGGETSQSTGVISVVRLRRPRTSGHHFRRFVNNRARQLPP